MPHEIRLQWEHRGRLRERHHTEVANSPCCAKYTPKAVSKL